MSSFGSAISCGLTRNKKKVEVIQPEVVAENISEYYKVSAQTVLPSEEVTVDVNVPSEEPVEIIEDTKQAIQEPETQVLDAPDTNEANIVESENEEPVEELNDNVTESIEATEQVQEANDTQKLEEENVESQETEAVAEAPKKPRGRAKKA